MGLTEKQAVKELMIKYGFAAPDMTVREFVEDILSSAQPDRSLWFRIGEICVDESKGFISAGRAFEKIRELLREAERREE